MAKKAENKYKGRNQRNASKLETTEQGESKEGQRGQDQDMVGCDQALERRSGIRDNQISLMVQFGHAKSYKGQVDERAGKADTITKK